MIPAILTTLLFALTAVCANRASWLLGSSKANLLRLSLATLILGIWAHFIGKGLAGGVFSLFYLAGCIGFGVGGFAMFQALPRLGSPLAMLAVECTSAVAATVVGILWLREILTTWQLISISTILLGVILGSLPRAQKDIPRRQLFIGLIWTLVAGCGQGVGLVISRKAYFIMKSNGFSMDGGTAAYQRLLGGLTIALLAFAMMRFRSGGQTGDNIKTDWGPQRAGVAAVGRKAWFWVVANTLFGPVFGVSCLLWAVSLMHPGIVQSIVATAPLISVPFARLMEGKRPSISYYVGAGVSILGLCGLFLL